MSKLDYPHRGGLFKPKVANDGPLVANETPMVANTQPAKKATRHGKYRDLDKRRRYMREYMRRKRAAAHNPAPRADITEIRA